MSAATASLKAATQRDLDLPAEDPKHRMWLIVGLAIALLYPLVDQALGIGRIGSFMAIMVFVVLAMGLNIVVGYAGLLDLGYAAFFAIGAYTMGLMTSPGSPFVKAGIIPGWLQNFWAAMALSWIVAAIFGVLLGSPTLRLRGDYLAIVTLGFGEIVPAVFLNAEPVTGGTKGLNPIAKPPSIGPISFGQTDQRNWYYLMLGVVLLSLFLITRLHDSRLGRSWMAVREDEIAASSMGVNLVRTKLWAFALGASFAGFAGSVYASWFQIAEPSQFLFSVSVTILAMVILGGLGNIYGVVIGAILIGYFDRILTEQLTPHINSFGEKIGNEFLATHNLTADKYLVFGLALVLMMLWRPEGLFPSSRRKAELHPEGEVYDQEQQQLYDMMAEDESMDL